MLRFVVATLAVTAMPAWAGEGDGAIRGEPGSPLPTVETMAPMDDGGEAASRVQRAALPVLSAFAAVGVGADGSAGRIEPGAEVRVAMKPGAFAAAPARIAEDPAYEGNVRAVFGDDDRVQITATDRYPFRAIGYLQMRTADGKVTGCSGTLIGPRTVLTAAHCLYNHQSATWRHSIEFFPGLRANGDAPLGVYAFEEAWILEGYLQNYKGFYGSVVPWDLGLVILKTPAGDSAGWMTPADKPDLGAFTANIVGYPGDKPLGTMWRASCDVVPENVLFLTFFYQCDTFPGSSGSAVYDYDPDTRQRFVYGVNVAENPKHNTAVRLNGAYLAWVKSLTK